MTDSVDDFQQRLRDAARQVLEHPGYVEYAACEAYRFTLDSVFLRNWGELNTLLEQAVVAVLIVVGLFTARQGRAETKRLRAAAPGETRVETLRGVKRNGWCGVTSLQGR